MILLRLDNQIQLQRFEIWGELFVVVLFLCSAQKQHNNKFFLFSQKAFPNF